MPANRRELRRNLFNLAIQQGGYFTAAQAKEVGYSHQAQAHHLHAGNWERHGRGLFRLVEWVSGPHGDLARWSLWSKDRAVVSHETAMEVYGMGELESSRIHLTVPPGFPRRDDALVLHFGRLSDTDILQHDGFRVTTVLRSIIDVAAAGVDGDQLARLIHEAKSSGALTVRQLRARSEILDVKAALRIEQAIQQMEKL